MTLVLFTIFDILKILNVLLSPAITFQYALVSFNKMQKVKDNNSVY